MKTKKLKLSEIYVNSFTTKLDDESNKTILGAINNPHIDTSRVNGCTPHGTVVSCTPQFNSNDVCITVEIICKIGSLLFDCGK